MDVVAVGHAVESHVVGVAGADPDLYYDDDSAAPAEAALIEGLVDIQPGETVLVLITGTMSNLTIFNDIWGSVIDLTGIEIGYADGSNLGSSGDVVTIWMGMPNTTLPIISASYPDASLFDGQSYDLELGEFSVVGNANGAVQTFAGGGDNMDVPNIGSPGNQEPNSTDEAFRTKLSVYPNPTADRVTLAAATPALIEQVTVQDAAGKILFQQLANYRERMELDLSALPAGLYFVEVHSNNGVFVERLIKQ